MDCTPRAAAPHEVVGGGDAIHQWPLGAAACYLLVMLTAALLMTSSYPEGQLCP